MAEYIDGIIDTLGNNLEIVDSQARTDIEQINSSLTNLQGQISTATIGINTGNKTSFSFSDLHNLNNTGMFKHGIVVIGTSSTSVTAYLVWVSVDNSTVTFTNLTSVNVRTLTGSVSGNTLTINADSTVYGGMKLIWLT